MKRHDSCGCRINEIEGLRKAKMHIRGFFGREVICAELLAMLVVVKLLW